MKDDDEKETNKNKANKQIPLIVFMAPTKIKAVVMDCIVFICFVSYLLLICEQIQTLFRHIGYCGQILSSTNC